MDKLKALGIEQQMTSMGFELAPDMRTILQGPVPVIPGANVSTGTGFEGERDSAPDFTRGTLENNHFLPFAVQQ